MMGIKLRWVSSGRRSSRDKLV